MNRLLLAGAGMLFSCSAAFATVLYDLPLKSDGDLKKMTKEEKAPAAIRITDLPGTGSVLEISIPKESEISRCSANLPLKGSDIAGKRIVISVDAKNDMVMREKKWGAGWISVHGFVPPGKKVHHYLQAVGKGKTPWKKYRMEIDMPDDVINGRLALYLKDAKGALFFRNLKVESLGTLLNLEGVVNMGFADEVAGDGKGGWHDQGASHDASTFPLKNKNFANVPFKIIDPRKNNGKSIVVFECPKLPQGPKSVEVKPPAGTAGKYLYLLHCSAWEQAKNTRTGTVLLEGTNGKRAELPVVYGRDLAEWWGGNGASNAVVGTRIVAQGGVGAAYVSRFEIPAEIGTIAKITFRKEPGATAMWMLIGATVSDIKFAYPESKILVMKADDIWKPLPERIHPVPKAGSALDFSVLYPKHTAGEFGRLVIGKSGHFEFEKRPGIPVRFMSACMGRDFGRYFGTAIELGDKEMIERYADQIQRAGYNLIRFWASALRDNGGWYDPKEGWNVLKPGLFSQNVVDRMDYFVSCLKKRGIYVMISIMIPTFHFENAYPYGNMEEKGWNLYLNPESLKSWCEAAEKVLTHKNPYTGMRWIDDPQIVLIDCNNEQEFVFWRATDKYAPLFRKFLKEKYKNFAALKKAWGKEAESLKSFEDIRTFHNLGMDKPGQVLRDRAEFITEQESGLYRKERAFLRKIGFKGPVTSFLLGRSMRDCEVRKDFDFVSLNGYHAHPLGGGIQKGGRVPQASSIGAAANIIRSYNCVRQYGKPFTVTEHGHTFWNKYRYEQGFIMGGYAALNGYDALTAFFMPVTTHRNYPITTYEIRHDPVSRAAELMTNLLFRRGDVKQSDLAFRIKVDLEEVLRSGSSRESVSSTQLLLSLLGNCSVDLTEKPVAEKEVVMNRVGGSSVEVRQLDSSITDTKNSIFDLDALVRDLKKRGLLPRNNRTDSDKTIYESSTGELLMDASGKFMTINTARFQGVCGEAGSKAAFPNFAVNGMNRRGCVALASIDGRKALNESKRMLLFLVTNALNSGMSFVSDDHFQRLQNGTLPILLETGTFSVSLKTKHAASLKAWALGIDGSRLAELPLKKNGEQLSLVVNTAAIPNGPSLYVEFAER